MDVLIFILIIIVSPFIIIGIFALGFLPICIFALWGILIDQICLLIFKKHICSCFGKPFIIKEP
jgi:hypothetical protein